MVYACVIIRRSLEKIIRVDVSEGGGWNWRRRKGEEEEKEEEELKEERNETRMESEYRI